jgi:hypothetical protein
MNEINERYTAPLIAARNSGLKAMLPHCGDLFIKFKNIFVTPATK